MQKSQLDLKIENIRAIKEANIILNGITVIAGENGCGKSTISKLTYHLIKTSIEFDTIVKRKLDDEHRVIYRNLDHLTRDLSYFLDKGEYLKVRNSFRRLYHNENQLTIFDEGNTVIAAIDYLIDVFNEIPNLQKKSQPNYRVERIKRIIGDSLNDERIDEKSTVIDLLEKLKSVVSNSINQSKRIKELRPISVLEDTLDEAFYDAPLKKSYNLYEYGVPIIDRDKKKVIPIHSIQEIAYIDTPMILGVDFYAERSHWEDINELLTKKATGKLLNEIDLIFNKDIIKGNVNLEDTEISDKTFVYKRDDGEEFNLLECATGLKSFAILQILYKNGFLNDKTLLIIDEPEVHLHPQWIVEYGRLIVLLNKRFGVKFLIASHHPDMISAIKYIAEKEKTSSNVHFYLANRFKSTYQYNYIDLGAEIDEIFSSFNIALERIDLYGTTE